MALGHAQHARVFRAKGDFARARAHLTDALRLLTAHPVPIIEWKLYAELASLEIARGNQQPAREAGEATQKRVEAIARMLEDDALRRDFLSSREVRAALAFGLQNRDGLDR